MAISKEDILDAVAAMTVMDLNDLVKAFEEKFVFPPPRWPLAARAAVQLAAAEEKTEFDVVLLAPATRKSKSSRWCVLPPAWA